MKITRAIQGNIVVGVLLGAVLALPISAFAADQVDVTTGKPMVQSTDRTVVRSIGPSLKSQTQPQPQGSKDILWDLTHGAYLSYTPSGIYSALTGLLTGSGFTMTTTAAGLNHISLTPYQIIVVNAACAYTSAYTAAEVTAINAFVNGGGGLFLIGDNTAIWPANYNLVSAAFGVTAAVVNTTGTMTSFSAHPITAGVASLTMASGGTLTVGAPSSTIGLDPSSRPILAVATPGVGKVVTYGDANTCDNNNIGVANNQVFCLNVFNWLTTTSPVELQGFTLE